MLLREGEDDKGELAALREQEARAQRGRELEPADGTHERGDGRLDSEKAEGSAEDERPRSDRDLEVDGKARRDEEEAEEQPSERGNVRLDLVPVLCLREQHAGEEGSECVGEAEGRCEARHRENGDEGDREEGRLVACGGHEPVHVLEHVPAEDEDEGEGGDGLDHGQPKRRAELSARAAEERGDHEQRHDS